MNNNQFEYNFMVDPAPVRESVYMDGLDVWKIGPDGKRVRGTPEERQHARKWLMTVDISEEIAKEKSKQVALAKSASALNICVYCKDEKAGGQFADDDRRRNRLSAMVKNVMRRVSKDKPRLYLCEDELCGEARQCFYKNNTLPDGTYQLVLCVGEKGTAMWCAL